MVLIWPKAVGSEFPELQVSYRFEFRKLLGRSHRDALVPRGYGNGEFSPKGPPPGIALLLGVFALRFNLAQMWMRKLVPMEPILLLTPS
jgi:hypothetical protein